MLSEQKFKLIEAEKKSEKLTQKQPKFSVVEKMVNDPNRGSTKVFIQRDYSEGTAVQFQKKFPIELEGRIPRNLFDQTIQTINKTFDAAESHDMYSLFQGFCACLTGFLIYICFDTQYEKHMKKLAQYIQEQNETVYSPRGLMLINPMERGLRVIEIHIFGYSNTK
ncbi:golgin subfamily A member 7 isoform X1 [Hydra vulgaris]